MGRRAGESLLELLARQVERIRFERAVIALGLPGDGRALLVIVGHVSDTLVGGRQRRLVDHDEVVLAQVIEKRGQLVLEQGQPVLHPGKAATVADRFVKRVLRCMRPEHLTIAATEALDAVLVQQRLAGGQEQMRVEPPGAHLRIGIEGAQALQLVAEEIEPQRFLHAARKNVDDRTAYGIFALVDHRVGPAVALFLQQQR